MGLLRVHGTIDLSQFWPDGNSDADTTKIKVRIDTASGFEFAADGITFVRIAALETAKVRGETGTNDVLDTFKTKPGRFLTVRLEGVDAPELHYRPKIPIKGLPDNARKPFNDKNAEFRQAGAETATASLATELTKYTTSLNVECWVTTEVDAPNEVFDTYGRFIGVIHIPTNGVPLAINDWLLAEGWVLPAFYTSQSLAEIARLTALADTAWQNAAGVWTSYSYDADTFDRACIVRKPTKQVKPLPDPLADLAGQFSLPKLFRRYSQWKIARLADLDVPTKFVDFVSAGTGNQIHTLDELQTQGLEAAPTRYIGDFLNAQNELTLAPEEIIFREKTSTLLHADGTRFETW